MKRAIITGATGFVGANLARRLLNEGHEVHLLVRPEHTAWRIEEILNHVRLHLVDFQDQKAVDLTLSEIRPDWIFHLAAHGAYSWQKDISQIFQTNLISTIHLVEASLRIGVESFIHAGSSSEYGFKDHSSAETDWPEPNSHYACAKASATQYCRYSAQTHKANFTTLRLYSVFGPYEDADRLVPKLIENGMRGKLPSLVNPDTARDFVYIDDVCDAFIKAAQTIPETFGAVYNVGTGIQTTLREAVEIVRRLLNIPVEPNWGTMPARQWDTSVWVANSQKIQTELGWTPQFNFESGFCQTVAWHRARLILR
jgi:nucleoside-diphosphate-sugar epimerase